MLEMRQLDEAEENVKDPAPLPLPEPGDPISGPGPGSVSFEPGRPDTCLWWPELKAPLEAELGVHAYLWFKEVRNGRVLIFELVCWPRKDGQKSVQALQARRVLNRLHRDWAARRLAAGLAADSFHGLAVMVAIRTERDTLGSRYIDHSHQLADLQRYFPDTTIALTHEGYGDGRQCVGVRWAGGPTRVEMSEPFGPAHWDVDTVRGGVWLHLSKGYIVLVRVPEPPTTPVAAAAWVNPPLRHYH